MLNEWQNWCRLCAKENGDNVSVLVKNENISNLSDIIQKYFSIEILSNDEISTSICLDCHKFITEIILFSERSNKVQLMYSELKFNSDLGTIWIDINALRNQFGITTKYDLKSISKTKMELNENVSENDLNNQNIKEHEFINKKINIKNDEDKKDDDITEIDYLDENLLEIKYENQDNDDTNNDDSNNDNKIVTRSKKNKYEKRLQCKICYKIFKNENNYYEHNKNHNNYKCDKCNKSFKTKTRLNSHLDIHLSPNLKTIYPCLFCDKNFSKKVYLHTHVRTIHNNIKPYVCEECGKAFSTCGALKEHKYTHIDDTPYQCTKCPKKFKNKARLKTHIDTHNDTMYVCTTCGLQLNTRRTLLMHMVVHSDLKKHKCNFCGNEYKRAKALKNHLILHTGLRPYACPFCDKTFANGSNCRSHKKKAHPNELAALEASGEKQSIANIPKLEELKSVSLNEITKIPKQEIWNNDVVQTNFNDEPICGTQQYDEIQITLS